MSTDVISRIRGADPCPAPVAYDDTVAQRNIDAIVRTDLTVGEPAFAFRSSPRRTRLAIAAVTVGLVAVGSVIGLGIARSGKPAADANGPAPSSRSAHAPLPGATAPGPVSTTGPGMLPGGSASAWSTFSGSGVSFEYPTRWVSYPLTQNPATVAEVVTYLSTSPVEYVCVTSDGGGTSCHTPEPSLLDGGVFVSWNITYIPGQKLPTVGDDETIAGRPAKVTRGDVRGCPMGAVNAVTATIAEDGPDARGSIPNLLLMGACIGAGEDVNTDLAAIDRMLASLRIAP